MYECVYCKAKEQEVPGPCTGCGRQLTGNVEDMKVKDLRKILDKNGYRLEMEYVSKEPRYALAI